MFWINNKWPTNCAVSTSTSLRFFEILSLRIFGVIELYNYRSHNKGLPLSYVRLFHGVRIVQYFFIFNCNIPYKFILVTKRLGWIIPVKKSEIQNIHINKNAEILTISILPEKRIQKHWANQTVWYCPLLCSGDVATLYFSWIVYERKLLVIPSLTFKHVLIKLWSKCCIFSKMKKPNRVSELALQPMHNMHFIYICSNIIQEEHAFSSKYFYAFPHIEITEFSKQRNESSST